MNKHSSFGTAEVLAHSPWLGKHCMIGRGDWMVVDQCDLRGVKLKFGFSDKRPPLCGKCRSPIRPAEGSGEQVVWLAEEFDEWTPCCSEALADDDLTDEQRVERMWHEPDRSEPVGGERQRGRHVRAGELPLDRSLSTSEHGRFVYGLKRDLRRRGGLTTA
jgi:hypothetical protein